MPETRFRWIHHSVERLKLFFDIISPVDETCTEQRETHVKETDLPRPVLEMIAGRTVLEIPEEIREINGDTQ